MRIKLPTVRCKLCGAAWHPRQAVVRLCPACKSVRFNDPQGAIRVKVPRLHCNVCGYTWAPRREVVTACAGCGSIRFADPDGPLARRKCPECGGNLRLRPYGYRCTACLWREDEALAARDFS